MESQENSSPQETESSYEEKPSTTTKNKAKNSHPRRFNDEQIKSLESIFKQETKLDPRKKLEIARDLGLQPRQVAIWFQNKRARWKLKQMEQEYTLLRSNYNTLSIRFEGLKKENLSLQIQLQELSDLVKNLNNVGSIDHPNSSTEEMDYNDRVMNISRDDEKIVTANEPVKWDEDEEEEEKISQTWRNLSSSIGLFDQSCENSNWWEVD